MSTLKSQNDKTSSPDDDQSQDVFGENTKDNSSLKNFARELRKALSPDRFTPTNLTHLYAAISKGQTEQFLSGLGLHRRPFLMEKLLNVDAMMMKEHTPVIPWEQVQPKNPDLDDEQSNDSFSL